MSRGQWLAGLVVGVCFVISIAFRAGNKRIDGMFEGTASSTSQVFVAGCVSGVILAPFLTYALKRIARYLFLSKDEGGNSLYRLDHGILNVEVPPQTMWMNMGFWKQTTTFPVACRALLDEVLVAAGLLDPAKEPSAKLDTTRLKIIDLGFGCGDQTLYLTQLARKTQPAGDSNTDSPKEYLVDNYVGLTIVPSQFRFAQERLSSFPDSNGSRLSLFCADAADPTTWTKDIRKAVSDTSLKQGSTDVSSETSTQPPATTWVLALDTLYHFTPSRDPIFHHAYSELNASIMAFDLLLSDTPSFLDTLLLRLVCIVAATPFSNFITIAEYKKRLLAAGYDRRKIEIRDISAHVFGGMADFIERRDGELKGIGMTIGRYRGAGKVFKWWASSGVVRGCIVLARR